MAAQNRGLLRIAPWLLPIGIVIVWQIASSTGWLSTRILPSPEGVLEAFWTLSASGELWQHLAISSSACRDWLLYWRQHRVDAGIDKRSVALGRTAAGHLYPDVA